MLRLLDLRIAGNYILLNTLAQLLKLYIKSAFVRTVRQPMQ